MTDNPSAFSYFLSEKEGILIVSLIGPLLKKNLSAFEKCTHDVEASKAKWIILNFRDVPSDTDNFAICALTHFQKAVRRKPAELRLAGIHPELKKTYTEQGILRKVELANNLAEALQMITPLFRKAA